MQRYGIERRRRRGEGSHLRDRKNLSPPHEKEERSAGAEAKENCKTREDDGNGRRRHRVRTCACRIERCVVLTRASKRGEICREQRV